MTKASARPWESATAAPSVQRPSPRTRLSWSLAGRRALLWCGRCHRSSLTVVARLWSEGTLRQHAPAAGASRPLEKPLGRAAALGPAPAPVEPRLRPRAAVVVVVVVRGGRPRKLRCLPTGLGPCGSDLAQELGRLVRRDTPRILVDALHRHGTFDLASGLGPRPLGLLGLQRLELRLRRGLRILYTPGLQQRHLDAQHPRGPRPLHLRCVGPHLGRKLQLCDLLLHDTTDIERVHIDVQGRGVQVLGHAQFKDDHRGVRCVINVKVVLAFVALPDFPSGVVDTGDLPRLFFLSPHSSTFVRLLLLLLRRHLEVHLVAALLSVSALRNRFPCLCGLLRQACLDDNLQLLLQLRQLLPRLDALGGQNQLAVELLQLRQVRHQIRAKATPIRARVACQVQILEHDVGFEVVHRLLKVFDVDEIDGHVQLVQRLAALDALDL
mmetsp:Transcript_105963/g.304671  ORF Transcript_105963/g.304671 Transcript_105963/m.304671 type:complete len:439 (-) Transcript_105963:336-1652(-)